MRQVRWTLIGGAALATAALCGCGESAGAVTPAVAPASSHDPAEDVALAALPVDADLIVAVHPAEVHGAAAGKILSVAWSNWGARYLRTPVLTDPGLGKIAERARIVFVGGRFAPGGGYEELVLAGGLDELDCQKSRERIYRRRHDIENGQSVLGIDISTGEVRNMTAEEAQKFDKNFGEALDDMCE